MSVAEAPASTGLVRRARAMLLKPAAEWDVIEAEPATIRSLYVGYVGVLALIPAIATVFASMYAGPRWLIPFIVSSAVLGYGLALLSVFVMALIVNALAPNFGGRKDQMQAMKLVAYANTPAWVVSALTIIPVLGLIAVLAADVYALYVLYIGLPKMMKSPREKTTVYFVVVLLIAVILYLVFGYIVASITWSAMAAAGGAT